VDYSGTLLTIAELGVALAGFASLVSVIGRRGDDKSRTIDSFRLRSMLEIALRTVALALVPLPFLQFASSDPTLWRLSSVLALVSTAVVFRNSIRRARSVEGIFGERTLIVSIAALSLIGVLSHLANALGLGGSNAFSLYLGGLLLSLGISGLLFLSVASSVLRPPT